MSTPEIQSGYNYTPEKVLTVLSLLIGSITGAYAGEAFDGSKLAAIAGFLGGTVATGVGGILFLNWWAPDREDGR